ncbi:MAG: glycine--tRNA ligase subunit beta [Candidatus Margulisbacteria bacterium]|nr:glycine--tRNA ligase subunit beta [Candidatus Margulisiibacteriota bacterium]MBU1021338.1 glycine--tRNA ligase subunit beta [Candidatus Margulisiibacteriota bacterium]MBU1729173.1 glycine--tRNA ligase subunit beta [Candidatus Margulisiibacteriota bacterium]MBU1954846.1 glycine--tRNA ligase subunit beta [Candidatus Margulisiibacteriota bacterium]
MPNKIKPKITNAMLEIGTEEIPARFIPEMLKNIKELMEKELVELKLTYASLSTYGTPRRLVLYIENLAPRQNDEKVEAKGPPKEFAFDQLGNPTKAALGFANKVGVDVSMLTTREVDGREYVFVEYAKKGTTTDRILKEIFPKIITALYLPISMRWGEEEFKFIRPIHWMVAAFAGKVIKFELAGVKSGDLVKGHRFISGNTFKKVPVSALKDIKAYQAYLRKLGVILDQGERRSRIVSGVKKIIESTVLKPIIDKKLLEEVTYLVEFPDFLVGAFQTAFLKVPNEVLITSMKKNQKYFPVVDERGHLTNKFVVVTNCKVGSNLKTLREGNERVISARLSDARYFFEEDQKVPLASRVKDLEKIAFYKGLGNLFEKKDRLIELAKFIGKTFNLDEHTVKRAQRVAELCKADLTTQMVFEFTDLQGIMGREYAILSGEEKSIAQGIAEHYLPRFSGDILPHSSEGTIIALADKFDSLTGCFSLGLKPSGSHDPFGMRRQAHGIVKIILEKKLDLSLEEMVEKIYKQYSKIHKDLKKSKQEIKSEDEVIRNVSRFLADRLKNILKEEGIRHDLAEAALYEFNDILAARKKAHALQHHANAPWFKGVVESADRIKRLAANAKRENVLEHDFIEDAEKKMYEAYLKVNWEVGEKIKKGEFEAALQELSKFTPVVEKFFVDILVMHEDERIKTNRLALLKTLEKMYFEFADFSKIVIS